MPYGGKHPDELRESAVRLVWIGSRSLGSHGEAICSGTKRLGPQAKTARQCAVPRSLKATDIPGQTSAGADGKLQPSSRPRRPSIGAERDRERPLRHTARVVSDDYCAYAISSMTGRTPAASRLVFGANNKYGPVGSEERGPNAYAH